MNDQMQIDRERHALEIIEQQRAEITKLRHECILWEVHCERLTAIMELVRHKLLQIAERNRRAGQCRQHHGQGRGRRPSRSGWDIGLN